MIEKDKSGEVFEINIRLTTLLLVVFIGLLVSVILWSIFGLGYREAAANAPTAQQSVSAGQDLSRKYYITSEEFISPQALSICEQGYHFASLWEVLDTSNLAYAHDLGAAYKSGDLGGGPPTGMLGWIRTGYESEGDSGIPGRDNCNSWSTQDFSYNGSAAKLRSNWTAAAGNYFHGWEVTALDCSQKQGVWCVED